MEIDLKKSKYKTVKQYYTLLHSKIGMKRSHWCLIDTFDTLDEVAEHLHFSKRWSYDGFKYKIMMRTDTIEDVMVDPKEIMLMRMKHGF